jgi:hypothetical protein
MVKVVRRAYLWVLGGMLMVVLSGLWVAYLTQGPVIGAQQLRLRTERAALLQERFELEAERSQAESHFNQTQRALVTERAQRLELEKILANVQTELGRTQDQLAFFEDLLPPGPQGGLDIRAVDVVPHAEGLHYRVLLMRSGKATKPFVGALQFVAKGHCREAGLITVQTIILQPLLAGPVPQNEVALGTQSEYAKTPSLAPQQTEDQQAVLRLEFVQFQRGQGLLALPPGFDPQSVTVRVLGGDIVLASRVVAL